MIRIGVLRNENGEVNSVFVEPDSDAVVEIKSIAVQLRQSVTFHQPQPVKWLLERMREACHVRKR